MRAALLERLPPPGAATRGDLGSFRIDLWPPRPELPWHAVRGGRGRGGGSWTAEKLVALIQTFAAARGPDFTKQEFTSWARIGSNTVNRYCGSWRAARLAADLPPEPAGGDPALHSLHALLRTLHLNRRRRRPLTGSQLARAARLSAGPIRAFGGVKQVRNLYRLWIAMHPPADEA